MACTCAPYRGEAPPPNYVPCDGGQVGDLLVRFGGDRGPFVVGCRFGEGFTHSTAAVLPGPHERDSWVRLVNKEEVR